MNTVFNLCKFHNECEKYTLKSHTCTHGGGTYCGKYREIAKNLILEAYA